jgi:hypothetical protein
LCAVEGLKAWLRLRRGADPGIALHWEPSAHGIWKNMYPDPGGFQMPFRQVGKHERKLGNAQTRSGSCQASPGQPNLCLFVSAELGRVDTRIHHRTNISKQVYILTHREVLFVHKNNGMHSINPCFSVSRLVGC